MKDKDSREIPKISWTIPIVIIIVVIISIILVGSDLQTFVPKQSTKQHVSTLTNEHTNIVSENNLYSGPFAILDGIYGIDDTVFLIGSEIPLDSKGKIDFIRPDGRIHHTIQFDGSKSAINHYFTPVSSSDLKECSDCKFFGTWKISFRSNEGMSYFPIQFEVVK